MNRPLFLAPTSVEWDGPAFWVPWDPMMVVKARLSDGSVAEGTLHQMMTGDKLTSIVAIGLPTDRVRKARSVEDRFWEKVDRRAPDDCWPWKGASHGKGYGTFLLNGFQRKAHRVAYWLGTGEVPGDLHVCHSCDNPKCVNPSHLWLGTNADNSRDKVSKGRQSRGQRPNCKIDWSIARTIRASTERSSDLARQYGLTRHTITDIRAGRTWKEAAQ